MAANMADLLQIMVDRGASDLHITSGTYPQIRVNGRLTPLTQFEVLAPQDTQRLSYSVLNEAQKQKFEEDNELDLSFGIQGLARFRCNVYRQRGAVGSAIRVIPYKIRTFDELSLPQIVQQLADRPKGLILVTGPTGSGKSTTLAAMIDKVNNERHEHIMTIEDPIEFVHPHKQCLVNQREVFADTHSFKNALKSILRQDPDVVLVGEMRDLETISAALTIAETGHLTLGTLHTNSCAQTINRIIDVFPTSQQGQVRAQLSLVLEGVLSQQLIPTADGRGRAMSLEIMAPDRSAAVGELRRRAILVTKIAEKTAPRVSFKFGGKVNDKEMAIFTRQFSTMIDAGLPLVQCLNILAEQSESKTLRSVTGRVARSVEQGSTLADSLRRHPRAFDDLFTNMVEVGESGGILDVVFQRLAAYIEKAAALKRKVKGAMIYPASIISVAFLVVIFMLTFVIPTFTKMFKDLGADLPL